MNAAFDQQFNRVFAGFAPARPAEREALNGLAYRSYVAQRHIHGMPVDVARRLFTTTYGADTVAQWEQQYTLDFQEIQQ